MSSPIASLPQFSHIFEVLIRLRQAVCHPYLVSFAAGRDAAAPTDGEQEATRCGLCLDPLEDGILTGCHHPFCRACIAAYDGAGCPTCSKKLSVNLEAPEVGAPAAAAAAAAVLRRAAAVGAGVARVRAGSILSRLDLASFQSSTKLEALRQELHAMLADDPSAKCLIFTQFAGMLDLIEYTLVRATRDTQPNCQFKS